MKITYNQQLLIENISSQVIQLCTGADGSPNNNYKTALLQSDNHHWAKIKLTEAINRVANILEPILSSLYFYDSTSNPCDSVEAASITFDLKPIHPLQSSMLPSIVESYLIGYVAEQWLGEKGIGALNKSGEKEAIIKSLVLKSSNKNKGCYRMI